MDNTPHAEGGLLSTLTRMFNTLSDAAGNRIELFLAEWREERLRLLNIMVLLLIGAVFSLTALMLISFAIVVAFWNTHPMLVLGLLIAFYIVLAIVTFGVLRWQVQRLGAFTATLEQIKKDLECFKEKN